MGLVAGCLAAAAAVIYPWPEPVDTETQLNQKLFPELALDQVRSLTITSFDRENRQFENIQLRRIRDSWLITTAADYPAGNTSRIASVFDVIAEATILEFKSSDASTHQLYGVVDPDQMADSTTQTGFGSKVSLADNNNRPLAELIIGDAIGDNTVQCFVRIAGQPNVYVVQASRSIFSTRLADWVDGNLLDVKGTRAGGSDVRAVQIDYYILEGEKVSAESPLKYIYRADFNMQEGSLSMSLAKPVDGGGLGDPQSDIPRNPQTVQNLVANLRQIQYHAVGKKPSVASQALLDGKTDSPDLDTLNNFGFRRSTQPGRWFDSKNGQLIMSTQSGVDWTLSFGAVAVNANAADVRISYYLVVTATVNESTFPEPPPPTDPENADQKTEYERAVQRRTDSLAAARNLAKQYNDRHAPWLYLIGEEALRALRPEESALTR
jgi:hypothetical protein